MGSGLLVSVSPFYVFLFFLSVTFFSTLRCTYDSNLIYLFGVGSLFVGALYSEMALAKTEQSYQTLLDEPIQHTFFQSFSIFSFYMSIF